MTNNVISLSILEDQKKKLTTDFDNINNGIKRLEGELVKLRNNLNAVYGAIQQTEVLIKLSKGEEKPEEKPEENKEVAASIATS
jgi:hypothetical protein